MIEYDRIDIKKVLILKNVKKHLENVIYADFFIF